MSEKKLGDELIDSLEDIRLLLNKLSDRLNESGVERTVGLREAMGKDCSFYTKSLDLFLRNDYKELRDLVYLSREKFLLIEGKDPKDE